MVGFTVGDVHAPARRRRPARRNPDPGRRNRASGDRQRPAGDGGDARAGLLRVVRRARRHDEGAGGGDRVDPEEQGVPEGRPRHAPRRWCQLPQRAAPQGARPVCLPRPLLQPRGPPHPPRMCRHCCYQGEHGGRVLRPRA